MDQDHYVLLYILQIVQVEEKDFLENLIDLFQVNIDEHHFHLDYFLMMNLKSIKVRYLFE